MNTTLCECGCGKSAPKNKRFLPGHNLKLPLSPWKELIRRKKISETMKQIMTDGMRESRRKSSTGRKHTDKAKKKMSIHALKHNAMKGKTPSQETKDKISKALTGRIFSKETKEKISKSNKGRVISKQQRQDISRTLKEFNKNHPNHFKGKKHSPESIEKMRKAMLGRYDGPNHPQWLGGKSNEPYCFSWEEISLMIKFRDGEQCQNPGCRGNPDDLTTHHIDYNKKNCDFNNLITLCRSCNARANFNRPGHQSFYSYLIETKNRLRK